MYVCGYVLMRACVRASYHLVFILECENNRTNLSLLLLLQKKKMPFLAECVTCKKTNSFENSMWSLKKTFSINRN